MYQKVLKCGYKNKKKRITKKTKNKKASKSVISRLIVIAEGFEPSTACLEGRCSIQLSYGRIRQFADLLRKMR